ncbi:MAG: hypothetical protein AAF623_18160, partial [Planctomycetota bacterium]
APAIETLSNLTIENDGSDTNASFRHTHQRIHLGNRAGDSTVYEIKGDTINLSYGGSIQIHGDPKASWADIEIEIDGSNSQSDYFVIEQSDIAFKLNGNGGNDSMFVGSTNESANGNLDRIENDLEFEGGDGENSLFVNNQANEADATYELSRRAFKFNGLVSLDSPDIRFSDIDLMKVNSSDSADSEFVVSPSRETRFLVKGGESTNNKLTVRGLPKDGAIANLGKRGSWLIDQQFERIYFENIEDTFDNIPLVENPGDISQVNLTPLKDITSNWLTAFNENWSGLSDSVLSIKSLDELDKLIDRLDGVVKDAYVDQLDKLVVDFENSNLLFVKIYKPLAVSDLLLTHLGQVENSAEIDFVFNSDSQLAAQVVGYETRVFEVTKAIDSLRLHTPTGTTDWSI